MDDSSEERDRLQALTSALIHRFNNVLMGIQPHVEVIKRAGKDNEKVLSSATQIETALRRAKAVMSEVSRLARPAALDVKPIEVDSWFASLRSEVQAFATNPVDLSFDAPPDLVISGDREQLTRALVHLVTNAVESMPGGGKVAVKAAKAESGFQLQIADNGGGITPDAMKRVFEPLFTTKRNSAGLGLAVVKQIVEAHGGTVRLESEPGVGTTATVYLSH